MTEPIEIPPGTYVLPKTIALTEPGWQDALRSALQEQNPAPLLAGPARLDATHVTSASDRSPDRLSIV